MKHRFLVTGITSGIGRYLFENLPDCAGLDRTNFDEVRNGEYETVIHSAFNKLREPVDYYRYLDDNILLTSRVLSLKYERVVYLSSIDVYGGSPGTYAMLKRFAESMVMRRPGNLILRCSTMLGPHMKPNHITKLLAGEPALGLSGDSIFNYILYSDLLEFMLTWPGGSSEGTIDFVARGSVRLNEVRSLIGVGTGFGDHRYSIPADFPNPVYSLYPAFDKTSLGNLKQFIAGYGAAETGNT